MTELFLCCACHELRSIVYVDPVERAYCAQCVVALPVGSVARTMQFHGATIPFRVGDRVAAHTAGEIYDGIGTVTKIRFDHRVAPVDPEFRVVIDEPADELAPRAAWYRERCLLKAADASPLVRAR